MYLPIFQIQKQEVDRPKLINVDFDTLADYPPRFSIYINPNSDEVKSKSPKLLIEGLNIVNCSFELLIPSKFDKE